LPLAQIIEWYALGDGEPTVDVGSQVFAAGSYRPPVPTPTKRTPPQTTIFEPLQTMPGLLRGVGAPDVAIGDQVFVAGS
jgi:hypothetical protein